MYLSQFSDNQHTISDIYDANVGDVMVMSEPADMIYTELLANLKMGVVQPKPNGQNVVRIVNTLTASELAKLLVYARFCDNERFVIAIPNEINKQTLKVVLYKLMKEQSVFYKISVSMGYLTAIRKGPTLKNNRRYAVSSLTRLLNSETLCDRVPASMLDNVSSFMQAVRREAERMGILIKMSFTGGTVEIRLVDSRDVYTPKTIGSFTAQFNKWLDSIPFSVPVEIPDFFTDKADKPYIKNILHNSDYDVSYRRGTVTKMKACLRKSGDSVFLRVNGKTIHQFTGVASKNSLTADQIKLVDMLLLPYGIKHKDLL